ncbi:MAG: c-type cytochrome [Gammaproteobacteria bacterium]|nr:c-type cytochrome [Gammaproteobacteria bacterium]
MIRFLSVVGTLLLVAAVGAQNAATVNTGVYTAAQSERGELKYLRNCRECHERNLMGGGYDDIPPIKGDEFLSNWTSWSVGDVFDFIETEMPPKEKDRVGIEPLDYADILAYILSQNGYAPGQEELPPDFDLLAEIEMAPPPAAP